MFSDYIKDTVDVLNQMSANNENIEILLAIIEKRLREGGTLYLCGNGGSAADAQHWAAEFIGRFRINGKPMPAIALTTNTSAITAIANDYSYNSVFSRQLEATGKPEDILFAISTSGNSDSIIEAAKSAKKLGILTVAFTGSNGGRIQEFTDVLINVPSEKTEIIQHAHLAIGHYIAGVLEHELREASNL